MSETTDTTSDDDLADSPLHALLDVGVLADELAALCADRERDFGERVDYPRILEMTSRAVAAGIEKVLDMLDKPSKGAPR